MTYNSVSFKRRRFLSTETIFHSPKSELVVVSTNYAQIKKYALAGFSKFDAVPAFVKTEVGRRFVVNSACYKFLALLFTMISWS